jgi:small subunit ribosomal protein S8
MTDPITDMLNRISNAQAVLHPTVEVPFSNLKYEIAKILEKEGFVKKVEKKGKTAKKNFEIVLKYEKKEISERKKTKPVIIGLKRISKPGQRIYIKNRDIRRVREGYGIKIISTPQGLMTNMEAKKKKTGGEVICEVW